MEKLTQDEHMILFLRLSLDNARKLHPKKNRKIAELVIKEMQSMTLAQCRQLVIDTRNDSQQLYQIYLLTIDHE